MPNQNHPKGTPTIFNKNYIKLTLAAFLWGGTMVAGKMSGNQLSPILKSTCRFSIASILLAIIIQNKRAWIRPSKKELASLFLMGLTGVAIYNLFFFAGLKLILASRASLIIATNPICTLLYAFLFLNEKVTFYRMIGILISLFGAIIVITNGDLTLLKQNIGHGELFIFGCVISWIAYVIIGKSTMKSVPPLIANAYSVFSGCALLIISLLFESNLKEISVNLTSLNLENWLALIYLGSFGTVLGYKFYLEATQEIGPARASQFINLIPLFGVSLSAFILRETITLTTILGGGLIIGGIFLTNKAQAIEKIRNT